MQPIYYETTNKIMLLVLIFCTSQKSFLVLDYVGQDIQIHVVVVVVGSQEFRYKMA